MNPITSMIFATFIIFIYSLISLRFGSWYTENNIFGKMGIMFMFLTLSYSILQSPVNFLLKKFGFKGRILPDLSNKE